MKQLTVAGLLIALLCCAASCKKEKGDPGPAGPAGNANVTVINYGAKTFSSQQDYMLPASITQGMLDSSLVLAYYNPSNETSTSWYAIPGQGSSGSYETRSFTYVNGTALAYQVRLMKPDGSGSYTSSVTFTKLKIVIAPASKVLSGARQASPVDYKDYYAVMRYYHLPLE